MKTNLWKTLLATLVACTLSASAQVTVRKTAGDKMGVDLSGIQVSGAAAQAARRTLELDLARSGWTLDSLALYDFYPQTGHIESLARLSPPGRQSQGG